jgi:hypothetical protein
MKNTAQMHFVLDEERARLERERLLIEEERSRLDRARDQLNQARDSFEHMWNQWEQFSPEASRPTLARPSVEPPTVSLLSTGRGWDAVPEGLRSLVRVNVNGEVAMEMQRSVLCVFEGSSLCEMFSGRNEEQMARDQQGRVFVHCGADVFIPLVAFLRRCRVEFNFAAAVARSTGGAGRNWQVPLPTFENVQQADAFNKALHHFGLLPFLHDGFASGSGLAVFRGADAHVADEHKLREEKAVSFEEEVAALAFHSDFEKHADPHECKRPNRMSHDRVAENKVVPSARPAAKSMVTKATPSGSRVCPVAKEMFTKSIPIVSQTSTSFARAALAQQLVRQHTPDTRTAAADVAVAGRTARQRTPQKPRTSEQSRSPERRRWSSSVSRASDLLERKREPFL